MDSQNHMGCIMQARRDSDCTARVKHGHVVSGPRGHVVSRRAHAVSGSQASRQESGRSDLESQGEEAA
ncbi:unnamed protein product [Lampetra planeri]